MCTPYNADFDGDEMNIHCPQTEEARAEAVELMSVHNNLCTPKNGEILVAATQDFLTASYLLTSRDTFLDRAMVGQLVAMMGDALLSVDLPTPAIVAPVELWTGKQVFSVLIRPKASDQIFVNLEVAEKQYTKNDARAMCPEDGYVTIQNSEIVSGQLGKATLGSGNKAGLFYVLNSEYGAAVAATAMNRVAKLSARWLGQRGFSVGIDDVTPGHVLQTEKARVVARGYADCDARIAAYKKGTLALQPGCDAEQTLEAEVLGILSTVRETAGAVCLRELPTHNAPLTMALCGSKGSTINISQMVACVEQQAVGGARPGQLLRPVAAHFRRGEKLPRQGLRGELVFHRHAPHGVLLPHHGGPRGAGGHRREDGGDRVHVAPADERWRTSRCATMGPCATARAGSCSSRTGTTAWSPRRWRAGQKLPGRVHPAGAASRGSCRGGARRW